MSTTTELALLHQQIDSLTTYFGWIIGSVTLTVTVLLALFALIQFVYQNKIQRAEIKVLEEELDGRVDKKIVAAEERLKKYAEIEIEFAVMKLKNENRFLRADIARRFAIDCDKEAIPATAADWWIQAAADYLECGSEEMYRLSIKNGRKAIEKISNQFGVDSLIECSPSITTSLERIAKTHKTEADIVIDVFKAKIKEKLA